MAATVRVVNVAASEVVEDVDGGARMLLTRLAAIRAWPISAIVP